MGESKFSVELDMLGQQPMLNTYTPLCFFYKTPKPEAEDLKNILRKGLHKLTDAFPWIAGQVVEDFPGSGFTKIVPRSSHTTPELVEENRRNMLPPFKELLEKNFPFGLIDEKLLCARESAFGQHQAAPTDLPVLVVQLNHIEGGVILGFVTHHTTCDITGMGSILSLFNKACHNEPFTESDLRIGNRHLDTPIQLLEEDIKVKENPRLEMQIKPQITPQLNENHVAPAHIPPPTPCRWEYFSFSPESLKELKAKATNDIPEGGAAFVSTDDALSALIWQCITRARGQHKDTEAEGSICARAIDVRPFLGLPLNYPGMAQNETYTRASPRELKNSSLGALASRLRQDLIAEDLKKDTQALITLMTHDSDKSKYFFACGVNWSRDTMISSWSKVDGYNMDFGLGVKPTCVRRPRFDPVPGLIFMMPKRGDGEISVAACLKGEEMDNLKKDDDWTRYAEPVET